MFRSFPLVCFLTIFLAATVFLPAQPAENPIRLAVVDIGTKAQPPEDFLALLDVQLSKDPAIALLERGQIKTILKEQALAATLGGELDSAGTVHAGNLLGAEALLLIEAEKNKEGETDLWLRFYNARVGILLLDTRLQLARTNTEYERQATLLAQRVCQQAKRFHVPVESMLLVGVSTIRSEELAKRWDWISDAVARKLERQLSLYPGVALMTRSQTEHLMKERDLSNDLPRALAASVILLDGSFKSPDGKNGVSLQLNAKRGGGSVGEVRVEGTTETLENLCTQAAQSLLEKLRQAPVQKAMDSTVEAGMLMEESRVYQKRGEYDRAIQPAEAACALVPDSFEYQWELFRILSSAFRGSNGFADERRQELFDHLGRVFDKTLSWAVSLEAAGQPLPAPKSYGLTAAKFVNDYFSACVEDALPTPGKDDYRNLPGREWDLYENSENRKCDFINPIIQKQREIRDRYASTRPDLVLTAMDAASELMSHTPFSFEKNQNYIRTLLDDYDTATQGKTPRKAGGPLWVPLNAFTENNKRFLKVTFFGLGGNPADDLYWGPTDRFFDEMFEKHPNPVVQIELCKAGILFYATRNRMPTVTGPGKATSSALPSIQSPETPQYAKLRKLTRQYLDAAKQDKSFSDRFIPKSYSPANKQDYSRCYYGGTFEESKNYEISMLSEIWNFAIQENLVAQSPADWVSTALRLLEACREMKRFEDGNAVLEQMDKFVPAVQSPQPFQNRQASSGRDSVKEMNERRAFEDYQQARSAYQAEYQRFLTPGAPTPAPKPRPKPVSFADSAETSSVLCSVDSLSQLVPNRETHIEFRRLLVLDKEVVLVYSATEDDPHFVHSERFGLIRLDKKTGSVLSTVPASDLTKYDYKDFREPDTYYSNPSAAEAQGNVYVGVFQQGLLVFHKDGKVERLTEAQGLAHNGIRQMVSVGGKVYALVSMKDSFQGESGLLELVPETGRSRLLVSTRTENKTIPISGYSISGIAADDRQDLLWLIVADPEKQPMCYVVFSFNPATGQFIPMPREKKENEMMPDLGLAPSHEGDWNTTSFPSDWHMVSRGDWLYIRDQEGMCRAHKKTGLMARVLGGSILRPRSVNGAVESYDIENAEWEMPGMCENSLYATPVDKGVVCAGEDGFYFFRKGTPKPEKLLTIKSKGSPRVIYQMRGIASVEEGTYLLTDRELHLVPSLCVSKPGTQPVATRTPSSPRLPDPQELRKRFQEWVDKRVEQFIQKWV
jgi:tetratricopeptide (TPR) repeat protein